MTCNIYDHTLDRTECKQYIFLEIYLNMLPVYKLKFIILILLRKIYTMLIFNCLFLK